MGSFAILGVSFGVDGTTGAQTPRASLLAATPPMGWNRWDAYGPSVREDEVKQNTEFIASHLKSYGWKYVVVDIEWYQPDAHAHGYIPRGRVVMDAYGRFQPAENRFPSSRDGAGFKSLADYVHSKGLGFGIHIMRGIPREAVDRNLPIQGTDPHAAEIADKVNVCKWTDMEDTYGVDMTKPGAQAYYDSLARLYASWGVDFVKADDMARPFHGPEIAGLRAALDKTGRPIVLSLSPGPAPIDQYAQLKASAQMWRISNDFWDRWIDVKQQFDRAQAWEHDAMPGGWPDADMLPLGHIAIRGERGVDRSSLLTHDEQMTLWSIMRSPLMMGGDLPTSDPFTIGLLTNLEVLAVDQASRDGHEVMRHEGLIAWTATSGDGARYVALFNTADTSQAVDVPWNELGMTAGQRHIRDLWSRNELGSAARIHVRRRPHASVFYKVLAS